MAILIAGNCCLLSQTQLCLSGKKWSVWVLRKEKDSVNGISYSSGLEKKKYYVPQGKRGIPVYSHYLMELFPMTYALNSLIHKLFFLRGITLLKTLVKAGYRGRGFLNCFSWCFSKLGMPRIALIKFTQLLVTRGNLIALLCKSPCEGQTKASSRPRSGVAEEEKQNPLEWSRALLRARLEQVVLPGCVKGMLWDALTCGAGYCWGPWRKEMHAWFSSGILNSQETKGELNFHICVQLQITPSMEI